MRIRLRDATLCGACFRWKGTSGPRCLSNIPLLTSNSSIHLNIIDLGLFSTSEDQVQYQLSIGTSFVSRRPVLIEYSRCYHHTSVRCRHRSLSQPMAMHPPLPTYRSRMEHIKLQRSEPSTFHRSSEPISMA